MSRVLHAVGRLLAVPGPPEPPPGSEGTARVFRAAPPFYRLLLLRWGVRQIGGAVGLVASLIAIGHVPDYPFRWLLDIAETLGVMGFVAQVPFTLLLVSLDYRYRWYIVTDRSLRIREGILTVHEQTLGFANVQNVSIRRGPLQQLLGISDLEVRTAGGGTTGRHGKGDKLRSDPHLGLLRGLDDAETIRELILERLRRLKGSGLGDPDDAPSEDEADPGDAWIAGAAELLAATRELRRSLEGS